MWQKADGSVYTGNVYLGRQSSDASLCLVHADNHADLLDVTKGKYLTTPPPTSFEYKNKGIYYAPYTVFNTSGLHVIDASNGTTGGHNTFVYPPTCSSCDPRSNQQYPPNTEDVSGGALVVDPSYEVFYRKDSYLNSTCHIHELDYLKHIDLSYNTYTTKQIQRNNQLTGFNYPSAFTFDCSNSKITGPFKPYLGSL